MSSFTLRQKVLTGSILVGVVGAVLIAPAAAQQKAAPPDFSSDNVGWVGLNGTRPSPTIPPIPSFPISLAGNRLIGSQTSATRT